MSNRPIDELWLELVPDSELSRAGRLELSKTVGHDALVADAFKAGRLEAEEVPRILAAIRKEHDRRMKAWGY